MGYPGWNLDDALEILRLSDWEPVRVVLTNRNELAAEVESLRAAVRRVQELCAVEIRIGGEVDAPINTSDVLRALDGEA